MECRSGTVWGADSMQSLDLGAGSVLTESSASCIPGTHAVFCMYQFSSVAQWCPTLCDPLDCSTPGLPVYHQLPGLAQTHVCRVSDAIQPSHPLSSPSPAFHLPSIRVFSNESVLRIRWPKYLYYTPMKSVKNI